ncbi:hypothetical protein F5882DRAFT_387063 [Hyaloscypha sp. PMI_1271]|nr:hypothetical protein F5882DRAFT_387063 [Hyaloscypha sp. PMI_1271]
MQNRFRPLSPKNNCKRGLNIAAPGFNFTRSPHHPAASTTDHMVHHDGDLETYSDFASKTLQKMMIWVYTCVSLLKLRDLAMTLKYLSTKYVAHSTLEYGGDEGPLEQRSHITCGLGPTLRLVADLVALDGKGTLGEPRVSPKSTAILASGRSLKSVSNQSASIRIGGGATMEGAILTRQSSPSRSSDGKSKDRLVPVVSNFPFVQKSLVLKIPCPQNPWSLELLPQDPSTLVANILPR